MPGAVLMLGAFSFLHPNTLPEFSDQYLINILTLLVVFLLLGLMVGQGVHTAADNFEKAFFWLAYRLRNTVIILLPVEATLEIFEISPSKLVEAFTFEMSVPISYTHSPVYLYPMFSIICNWWGGALEWLRKRYWGGYDSLIGHRLLLDKSVEWNFDAIGMSGEGSARWEEGEKGLLFDMFRKEYQYVFDIDIKKKSPGDLADQYPLIVARLSSSGVGSFRHFQGIQSFCRSMWVVSFILGILYIDLILLNEILGNYIIKYSPIGLELIPQDLWMGIPTFFFFSGSLLFFNASGTYKKHFVEYLMAEFVTNSLEEREENGRENTTLDQFWK